MIGKRLAIHPLGAMPVDLPRLAQLAPRPRIARTPKLVMHGSLHPSAPLRFGAGKISPKWPEAKGSG